MKFQFSPRSPLALRHAVAIFVASGACLTLTCSAWAALESGVYRTLPDATVEEFGDRVPGKTRVVPFSATVTLDLDADQPSVVALLPNAVLEGGEPFSLIVRSSAGGKLNDGTYRFMGDYLQELQPSGSQYLFDWSVSSSLDGRLVWNGVIGWAGGHIWQITISNITIVPDSPSLEIAQANSQVTVSWPASYTGFKLEQTTRLPAKDWHTVTNSVVVAGDRFSVTVKAGEPQGFFRLRKF